MTAAQLPPYGNVKEAYTHLLSPDQAYGPWENRPDGDWVVVYFKETCVVRLFQNLEMVAKWYNWTTYQANVFVNFRHFAAQLTTGELGRIYDTLNERPALKTSLRVDVPRLPPRDANATGLDLSRHVWALCQQVGDRIQGHKLAAHNADTHRDKYAINLNLLKSGESQAIIENLPKQARIIALALAMAERMSYSEDELNGFARDLILTGQLKTKQNAFRVVRYYAPVLAELGFMSYDSRRVDDD